MQPNCRSICDPRVYLVVRYEGAKIHTIDNSEIRKKEHSVESKCIQLVFVAYIMHRSQIYIEHSYQCGWEKVGDILLNVWNQGITIYNNMHILGVLKINKIILYLFQMRA